MQTWSKAEGTNLEGKCTNWWTSLGGGGSNCQMLERYLVFSVEFCSEVANLLQPTFFWRVFLKLLWLFSSISRVSLLNRNLNTTLVSWRCHIFFPKRSRKWEPQTRRKMRTRCSVCARGQLLLYPWKIDTGYVNNVMTSVTVWEINHNMKTSDHSSQIWGGGGCCFLKSKTGTEAVIRTGRLLSAKSHDSRVAAAVSIFEFISQRSPDRRGDGRHTEQLIIISNICPLI